MNIKVWKPIPPYKEGQVVNFNGERMVCKMKTKMKLLLSWSCNIYGYYLVSLWAMNEEGVGCYEYAIETGISKIAALWNLAKRLKRQGQLKLLFHISKVEDNYWQKGPVKHFIIETVKEGFYVIRERHNTLLFLHYWDTGAESLFPNYIASNTLDARERIFEVAKEKGFSVRIHDRWKL